MKETVSEKLIVEAKHSFNKLLKTPEYQTIISDDAQRKQLIELLRVQSKGVYLDLATGNGYVGFALAEQYPGCSVLGLDIANEVIAENCKKAKELSLTNIDFRFFNGIIFPEFKMKFDGVVCRYALHHFPEIDETIKEIDRAIKPGSRVIISDAVRNEHDNEDFINKFQRLKKDGHVRMYTKPELVGFFEKHGFAEEESFYSEITFPRELSLQYKNLLETSTVETKEKYLVSVRNNNIYLTFSILNIAFTKNP